MPHMFEAFAIEHGMILASRIEAAACKFKTLALTTLVYSMMPSNANLQAQRLLQKAAIPSITATPLEPPSATHDVF